MIVIGIGHKARQGKNTLARELVILAGKNNLYAKQYGFADSLYSLARALGMQGKDPHVLQHLGADVMRRIEDAHWVHQLWYRVIGEEPDLAVITDVRFENEAESIRTNPKGYIIDLQRYSPSGVRVVATDRDPYHISETELDGYDFDKVCSTNSLEQTKAIAYDLFGELVIPNIKQTNQII